MAPVGDGKALNFSGVDSLLAAVDARRRLVVRQLDSRRRVVMGQFLTPAPVAEFMAGVVEASKPVLHVLDPGALAGSLSTALVVAMCRRARRPVSIVPTAYEIDRALIGHLRAALDLCKLACEQAGIRFEGRVLEADSLEARAGTLAGDLFSSGTACAGRTSRSYAGCPEAPKVEQTLYCELESSQRAVYYELRAVGVRAAPLGLGPLGCA